MIVLDHETLALGRCLLMVLFFVLKVLKWDFKEAIKNTSCCPIVCQYDIP